MSDKSFLKVRILAALIGGSITASVFYLGKLMFDTLFSNTIIIAVSIAAALIFFFTVKPKNN